MQADARVNLYEAARQWTAAVGAQKGRMFMGGAEPNLADLGVYGVLQAVRGMDTFNDVLREEPQMREWYEAVRAKVAASRLPADGVGYVDSRAGA